MATAKTEAPAVEPTLHVGEVLDRTIRLWARHFGACAGTTAVLSSPLLYLAWVSATTEPRLQQGRELGRALWAFWGGPVAVLFASAFLSAGVVRSLRGVPASFLGSFLAALKRLPALVWVAVLVVGVVFLWTMPGAIGMGFMAQAMELDPKEAENAAWFLLLTPLLIVLPVLALVRMSVVMPVVTVERRGGMSAVWRSHRLTKGNRWRVFAVFFALFLLHLVVQTGLDWVLPRGPVTAWLLIAHTILVTAGLVAVASVVVYEDLRIVKDGTDPEALGRVFE